MSKVINFIFKNNFPSIIFKIVSYIKYILISKYRKLYEYTYVFFDSNFKISKKDKILFVDCGSNLGQGYLWFSKFFKKHNVSYELFEPNPNCHDSLEKLSKLSRDKININKCGVGVENQIASFYGLDNLEGGAQSQGGSIIKDHNSISYLKEPVESIKVKIIKFSDFLRKEKPNYSKIIVKMDIEGAEVDLLESMLNDLSINYIDIIYIEFHSHFKKDDQFLKTKIREKTIIKKLKYNTKVSFRLWH